MTCQHADYGSNVLIHDCGAGSVKYILPHGWRWAWNAERLAQIAEPSSIVAFLLEQIEVSIGVEEYGIKCDDEAVGLHRHALFVLRETLRRAQFRADLPETVRQINSYIDTGL